LRARFLENGVRPQADVAACLKNQTYFEVILYSGVVLWKKILDFGVLTFRFRIADPASVPGCLRRKEESS
jgi:hypothetical protein